MIQRKMIHVFPYKELEFDIRRSEWLLLDGQEKTIFQVYKDGNPVKGLDLVVSKETLYDPGASGNPMNSEMLVVETLISETKKRFG